MRRIHHNFLVPVIHFSIRFFTGNSQNIPAFFTSIFTAFPGQIHAEAIQLQEMLIASANVVKDDKKDRVAASKKLFSGYIYIKIPKH